MTNSTTTINGMSKSFIDYPVLIDGQWVGGEGDRIEIFDKYKLAPFATVTEASFEQTVLALDTASKAFQQGVPVAFERGEILDKAAGLMEARLDDFVQTMQAEVGFPASDATNELKRCIQTLKLSAEEARRLTGDVIPMEGAPNQTGRLAFTLRKPLGVVAAITPFNAPLNTVAHKIAPAFAAGNAVILKPSSKAPITACKLAEVLVDAGMPRGFLSVLHGGAEVVRYLLDDQRVRFFAFTGSTEVGRSIQQDAGLRRTQMELGSISYTILCDDANLDVALPKIVNAGYRKAGQVCTSIQILLVQQDILQDVQDRLTKMVAALKYGDPEKSDTIVGPLISEDAAIRIETWIDEAIAGGAKRLVGGDRVGAVIPPTLLSDVDDLMKITCQEVFGPVMSLVPFNNLDEAIDQVNSTPFGLATGIFTNRLQDGLTAAQKLEVGGVHINETSSSRVDVMPYGGSKDSGFGREGPHYTVHEMTEERIVSILLQ